MKTKFSKLFVTILIVAAVTCCGALGVLAADDANADTAAATTASETVNTDNDHNSSLSIGLVAAALATGLAGIGGGTSSTRGRFSLPGFRIAKVGSLEGGF